MAFELLLLLSDITDYAYIENGNDKTTRGNDVTSLTTRREGQVFGAVVSDVSSGEVGQSLPTQVRHLFDY